MCLFVVVGMEKLVTIRRAKPSDKEAVLKIHDHVYDGQDYLSAYYDHFLSSSDFLTFVMIIDEQIVSNFTWSVSILKERNSHI